jgi:hypothetical protein
MSTEAHAAYEQGYVDGKGSVAADIRISVRHAVTLTDLLNQLRRITGDPDLELGSDYAPEPNPGTTYRRMAQEAERLAAQARYITARMQADYPTTTEENR